MTISRFSRFLTMLLAAIQFAAPALASVAEGSFSQRVADPQSHVEAYGQTDCTAPHAADCGICRFLSGNVGDAPVLSTWIVSVAPLPIQTLVVASGSGPARQGFDARGPPALVG